MDALLFEVCGKISSTVTEGGRGSLNSSANMVSSFTFLFFVGDKQMFSYSPFGQSLAIWRT
jgi:hypothetical protein